MFDTGKIGKYISFLRKNHNMTQGQLAEKLGVSHQAVSNWERGETMPDIAILTMMARTLNTTSDRILLSGEDAVIIDKNENTEDIKADVSVNSQDINVNSDSIQESYNIITNENERIIEKKDRIRELKKTRHTLKEKLKNSNSESTIDKIENLIDEVENQIDKLQDEIDYISEEIDEEQSKTDVFEGLENLAGLEGLLGLKVFGDNVKNKEDNIKSESKATAEDNNIGDIDTASWQNIVSIAPFASRATLDNLINKLEEKEDFNKILEIAPFISTDVIEKVVLNGFNKGDIVDWRLIIGLAPFASSETLNTLTSLLKEKSDFDKIVELAPFLSKGTLERVTFSALNDGDSVNWSIVISLAPFLSGGTLDKLILKLDKETDFNKVIQLAPFLSSETIDRFVNKNLKIQ